MNEVRARCHPESPMWVQINRAGEITLLCGQCGQEFLKFAVSKVFFDEATVHPRQAH